MLHAWPDLRLELEKEIQDGSVFGAAAEGDQRRESLAGWLTHTFEPQYLHRIAVNYNIVIRAIFFAGLPVGKVHNNRYALHD